MRVVHVGPPRARLGGPAGYLFELAAAAEGRDAHGHDVVFPPLAAPRRAAVAGPFQKLRAALGRARRRVLPASSGYRPPLAELQQPGGRVDASLRDVERSVLDEAAPLRAQAPCADVLFTHDIFNAAQLLDDRPSGAEIWLLIHAPFPTALYMVWTWAVPEADWRDILRWPDVRAWVDRELEVWSRVDRLLLPCREAGDEFVRLDPRFAEPLARADYVLSGAAAPGSGGADRAECRRRFGLPPGEPVGLYLGSAQPYRGLPALLAGLHALPSRRELPGQIAVAGAAPESLPRHDRLRPLGRVADVGALLNAVDFVINVNHFCLFDLSTIEAAQAGRALLLHATGGNRTMERLGAGCLMLADLEPATLAAGLSRLWQMPPAERAHLEAASRRCYDALLSPERFWAHHLAAYDAAADRRGAA